MRTIATISDFVTNEKHSTLIDKVEQLEDECNVAHNEFTTYIHEHAVEHRDQRSTYREELECIQNSIHSLRLGLIWTIVGLLCAGCSLIALCLYLII